MSYNNSLASYLHNNKHLTLTVQYQYYYKQFHFSEVRTAELKV